MVLDLEGLLLSVEIGVVALLERRVPVCGWMSVFPDLHEHLHSRDLLGEQQLAQRRPGTVRAL
jgi:hypothetical protein